MVEVKEMVQGKQLRGASRVGMTPWVIQAVSLRLQPHLSLANQIETEIRPLLDKSTELGVWRCCEWVHAGRRLQVAAVRCFDCH